MALSLRPHTRVVVAGVVAILAALGLLVAYSLRPPATVRAAVDTFLREKSVTLLEGIAPERIQVELGQFDFNLSRGRLEIHGVRVTYGDTTAARIALLKGSAPLVFLYGIAATDIIFRRRLVLSGVRIMQPVLVRQLVILEPGGEARPGAKAVTEPPPLTPDSAVYSLNTADSTLYATVAEWLPAELYTSHIERIHIEDGTLVTASGVPGAEATDTVSGLELDLRGLGLDRGKRRVFREALIAASWYRRDRPESPKEVVLHGLALRANPMDTILTLDSAALRAGEGSRLRILSLARSFSRQTLRVRLVALERQPIDSVTTRAAHRRTSGLAFEVRDFAVDGIKFGPLFRRTTLARRIDVGSVTFDLRAEGGGSATRTRKQAASATVDRGLPWGAAIDTLIIHQLGMHYTGVRAAGRQPTTLDVEVHRPVLFSGASFGRLVVTPTTPPGAHAPHPPHALDSLLYGQLARALPRSLHSARVESLQLEDARVVMASTAHGGVQQDSIGALTAHLRGVGYDSIAGRFVQSARISAPRLVLGSSASAGAIVLHGLTLYSDERNAVVSLDSTSLPAGQGYRLRVTKLRHELISGKLTLGDLAYAPDLDDEAFFQAVGRRTTRVRLDARSLAISGLDAAAAMRRSVVARKIDIGELQVDATSDQPYDAARADLTRTADSIAATDSTVAAGSNALSPHGVRRPLMPTQQLARMRWALAVDTVLLRVGAVRYTEVTPGTPAPATISFDHLSFTGTGLVNRKPKRPFDLRAFAAINGEGRIAAHFTLPIRRDDFTADVSGSWTGMPLAGLNTFLVASGFRLTDGTADSASFRFRIAQDSALGSLNPTWRGLRVRLHNTRTGKSNLGSRIKSFIAKTFVIRANNVPGTKGYRASVPIRYAVTNDDTFFGTLWRAMRSALIVAMKQ